MPGDAVPEGGAGQVFAMVFDLPAAGMSGEDLFHGGAAHAVSAERIGHEELRDRPVQRAVTFRNAVDERKARKSFLCVDQVCRAIVPTFKIGGQPLITEQAVRSVRRVTERLDERIRLAFGKSPDAEVVLMLGLGNGAGWATTLNGKPTVLLGIEKIVELHWCSEDDMNGLVLHELGHVYAAQFGTSLSPSREQRLLAQLFSEGIAMVFEQELVGNPDYFHQNVNGWTTWCHEHLSAIAHCFAAESPSLTRETQRYFGDWVSFEGHPDVGYYLGARFVRFLMEKMTFDEVLRLPLSQIQQSFDAFCASL